MIGVLHALTQKGVTVVCVTHDVEFAADLADRVALFFRGELISIDTPRRFFSGNRFYTTPISRMTKGFFGNAVTMEDAVCFCTDHVGKEKSEC
jgi:energy-coupling factor transport system ATP-binding protein